MTFTKRPGRRISRLHKSTSGFSSNRQWNVINFWLRWSCRKRREPYDLFLPVIQTGGKWIWRKCLQHQLYLQHRGLLQSICIWYLFEAGNGEAGVERKYTCTSYLFLWTSQYSSNEQCQRIQQCWFSLRNGKKIKTRHVNSQPYHSQPQSNFLLINVRFT